MLGKGGGEALEYASPAFVGRVQAHPSIVDKGDLLSLTAAFLLDLLTLSICGTLLVIRGRLRHSHPAVLYLIFHFLVFTLRGFGILTGAPTYLSGREGLSPTTPEEIVRGLNYADAFLVACTIGWLTAKRFEERRPLEDRDSGASLPGKDVDSETKSAGIPIYPPYLAWMFGICLPLGLIALLLYGFIPGLNSGPTRASTFYQVIAQSWPALGLSALIYKYGFRWFFATPLAFYFLLIALQGHGRYRLVLPAIFLMMVYLDRRGRRWPSVRVIALAAALFILFFPLKVVAQSYQQGASVGDLAQVVQGSVGDSVTGRASGSGTDILDEFSMALTQGDNYGHRFWGKPYLSLLTLPIPRPLWPNKPGLLDRTVAISTLERPMSTNGAVVTMPGDLYLNFGFVGMLVGGFILARILLRWYRHAYSDGLGTIQHLVYLLLASSLIQVFRDGPTDFVTFVVIRNAPLFVVMLLHYNRRIIERNRAQDDRRRRLLRPSAADVAASAELHRGATDA